MLEIKTFGHLAITLDNEAITEQKLRDEIADLADHVSQLYKNMDDSLRFKQKPKITKDMEVSEALPFLV